MIDRLDKWVEIIFNGINSLMKNPRKTSYTKKDLILLACLEWKSVEDIARIFDVNISYAGNLLRYWEKQKKLDSKFVGIKKFYRINFPIEDIKLPNGENLTEEQIRKNLSGILNNFIKFK